MAILHVDGKTYNFQEGQNLLHTCLSLGLDVPYFCWHPALGSVGACRQCAVKHFKDENDTQGEIVMSCMVPAKDGMRISIEDAEAAQFRAGIIELLMINHPHDCPVCDEGGECHLQDMTVMTGHHRRRYRFRKRTHRNQYLGPFIHHEMNRCIQCYRCVRYYRDYAGGRDFDVFASRDLVYFGRHEEGPLESEFSGNLVEICPTGVFTDKTLQQHYVRKWDLQTAPSICVHCGLGCNTLPGERLGTLRRVRNRYHHLVNGYFLCDRGRFGYDFVNSPDRIRIPLHKMDDAVGDIPLLDDSQVRGLLGPMLSGKGRVIGIGSPRASMESNFALRTLVGADNFFAGIADHEHRCLSTITRILQEGPAPAASLQSTGLSDAVLILGEDVAQTAPILGLNMHRLRFRQAVLAAAGFQLPDWNDAGVRELAQLQKPNLFIAAAAATRLDKEARQVYRASPGALVRLGAAVGATLKADANASQGLDEEACSWVAAAAEALRQAQRPLIVAGASYGRPELIDAAAHIAWELSRQDRKPALAFCVPECNSLGLSLLQPKNLAAELPALLKNGIQTVIALESDLYRCLEAPLAEVLFKSAQVIALDHSPSATTDQARVVLPAATFAEAAATFVNNEGRVQRAYAVMYPRNPVRPSWRWLQVLASFTNNSPMQAWQCIEDVARDLAKTFPLFYPLVELDPFDSRSSSDPVPRKTHRATGRTAVNAHLDVHEPKPPLDEDAPLAFSMEGIQTPPPPELMPRYWSPGWNSVQALNKFQSPIGGPLKGGETGRRLLEPNRSRKVSDQDQDRLDEGIDAPDMNNEEYDVVPLHHLFGSEAQSMGAPAVAQRAPKPYVGLSLENDLAGQNDLVQIRLDEKYFKLPVKLIPGLPPRLAGLPVGLPHMPMVSLPRKVKIQKI